MHAITSRADASGAGRRGERQVGGSGIVRNARNTQSPGQSRGDPRVEAESQEQKQSRRRPPPPWIAVTAGDAARGSLA